MSVSRCAAPPHFGHFVWKKEGVLASGLPLPSGTRSSGNTTGSWLSGTATSPHFGHCTIGIGVPQ